MTSRRLVEAAWMLDLDRYAGHVIKALQSEGGDPILLKGASLADLLYEGELRRYGDIDLLVAPGDFAASQEVLRNLGHSSIAEQLRLSEQEEFSQTWRHPGRPDVDLHLTFDGIGVAPSMCWEVLQPHTVPMRVGGAEARALDVPGRVLFVALHAMHHGPREAAPLEDLRRAITQVATEGWIEAHDLAVKLDALPAMAAGLSLLPEGRDLARAVGVGRRSLETQLRADGVQGPAISSLRLWKSSDRAPFLWAVFRKLFPSRAYMYSLYGRQSRLPVAYLRRFVSLVGQVPFGLVRVVTAAVRSRR